MEISTFHKIILSNLLQDKAYFKAVSPYLKKEYFEDKTTSVLYELISNFTQEYKAVPAKDVLEVQIENYVGLSSDEYKAVASLLNEITKPTSKEVNHQWLLDETEKYCREKAIYIAIMDAVSIIDGSDKQRSDGAIPGILQEALAVSFDKNVGHDYFQDIEERWDFYNRKESKIPSLITMLDKVTHGGVVKKTLNLVMAASGAGKSAFMCALAANYIAQGLSVLYITLELAEERVAERIDANLLNININQVKDTPKDLYCKKIQKIKEKSYGRLMIKEYPTGIASVNHFRALVDELRIKKDFKADVVIVDYLGICASANFKAGSSANTYTIQKSISEELRGFASEQDVVLWTGVQTNRSGFNNTDISETNISESIGILMTADFVIGLIRTPELDEKLCVILKQIKSRYGDVSWYNRFVVGFDRARMKMFDVDEDGSAAALSSNGGQEDEYLDKVKNTVDSQTAKKMQGGESTGWVFD